MIEMNNFVEFLFKKILEDAGNDELPVYFSETFKNLLKDIEKETGNEVAQRLLYEEGKKSKRIYVDLDPYSIDKVTFLMSNKAEEILGRNNNLRNLNYHDYEKIYNARQRGSMKINRFVNDLFNNEYESKPLTPEQRELNKSKGLKTAAQHLEDFVNIFKSMREPGKFELVKGSTIQDFYLEDTYENGNGTLGGSCMMYQECQDYLEFYAYNEHKISMLIMRSKKDPDKITGRALVWKLDTPSGRTFLDRIYTNYEHNVQSFKKYAKDNGWLYKMYQNMHDDEQIVDTVNDTNKFMTLVVNDIKIPNTEEILFPYLDTMKYYSPNLKRISNNIETVKGSGIIYKLEGTSGDDYYKLNNRTIEELREMYKDEILDDIRYYATELYSNIFWDYIDDDQYVQDFIDDQINNYLEDFEYIFDNEDDLIEYIKNNVSDESKLPDNLDEMDISELQDLTDKLNIRGEITREYAEKNYQNYTAKEIFDELYGNTDTVDRSIFNQLQYYFDADGFAEEIANTEDESYLRSKYEEEDL